MPVSKDLSDEATVALAKKLIDAQVYSLVVTGGEPLLRPSVLLDIVRMTKDKGLFVSVNTNLIHATPELLSSLRQLGLNSFLVSCPSSDPDTYKHITRCGNYETFRTKLALLMEYEISCLVNMVVTRENRKHVRNTATDLSRLGVKRFAATPASLNVEYPDPNALLNKAQIITLLEDLDWCAENLGVEVDVLEALPKCFLPAWAWEKKRLFTRRSCQAGRMSASISNTGDVRPCSHNPNIYGNLFTESLESIWDKMSEYRKSAIPKPCHTCPAVAACNGSCRTNALALTGSIAEMDRLMVGHISLPKAAQAPLIITTDAVVSFCGNFRWRKEIVDEYSMTTKTNHRNLLIVNHETLEFVRWLEKSLPMTVGELSPENADTEATQAFSRIMETLVRKEFISVG
jgi:radical SAM protein with 4Fe4S-binding SPASM domain